jgi:hypothetical protein
MHRFLSMLTRSLRGAKPARTVRRTSLQVEALEDRTVMTVGMLTQFNPAIFSLAPATPTVNPATLVQANRVIDNQAIFQLLRVANLSNLQFDLHAVTGSAPYTLLIQSQTYNAGGTASFTGQWHTPNGGDFSVTGLVAFDAQFNLSIDFYWSASIFSTNHFRGVLNQQAGTNTYNVFGHIDNQPAVGLPGPGFDVESDMPYFTNFQFLNLTSSDGKPAHDLNILTQTNTPSGAVIGGTWKGDGPNGGTAHPIANAYLFFDDEADICIHFEWNNKNQFDGILTYVPEQASPFIAAHYHLEGNVSPLPGNDSSGPGPGHVSGDSQGLPSNFTPRFTVVAENLQLAWAVAGASNSSIGGLTTESFNPAVNSYAVTLDASALGVPSVSLDGVAYDATAPIAANLLPGQHTLTTDGTDVTAFTVNADGTVSYDPSLEGALTGSGTAALTVNGYAVTLDATALGVADVTLDGVARDATAPFAVNLLPGQHSLSANGTDMIAFSVNADGTIAYDPGLEGVLTGSGTTALTINGYAVTLDATALGVTSVALDGVWQDATAPFGAVLRAGQHSMTTNGSDVTSFTVNADGTVSYDPSLEGALTGSGTTALTVNGYAVTLDATALGVSSVALDGVWQDASAPLFVNLLPGQHTLTTNGSDVTSFLVNSDGTVSYDPSLEGALTGSGTAALTVNGYAVTLDATALGVTSVALDGVWRDASAPLTINLLPGQHTLTTNGSDVTSFTVNPDGTVSYDPSLEGALTGNGTTALTLHGYAVALDATALGVASVALDGVWQDATTPFVANLLPGQHSLTADGTNVLWFTVNSDGTITYDPSLEGTFTGSGTTSLVFQTP